jgi:hypothetical protein
VLNGLKLVLRKERWREEIEILEAEQQRCCNFFGFFASVWKKMADKEVIAGKKAYFRRHSAMFDKHKANFEQTKCGG